MSGLLYRVPAFTTAIVNRQPSRSQAPAAWPQAPVTLASACRQTHACRPDRRVLAGVGGAASNAATRCARAQTARGRRSLDDARPTVATALGLLLEYRLSLDPRIARSADRVRGHQRGELLHALSATSGRRVRTPALRRDSSAIARAAGGPYRWYCPIGDPRGAAWRSHPRGRLGFRLQAAQRSRVDGPARELRTPRVPSSRESRQVVLHRAGEMTALASRCRLACTQARRQLAAVSGRTLTARRAPNSELLIRWSRATA